MTGITKNSGNEANVESKCWTKTGGVITGAQDDKTTTTNRLLYSKVRTNSVHFIVRLGGQFLSL